KSIPDFGSIASEILEDLQEFTIWCRPDVNTPITIQTAQVGRESLRVPAGEPAATDLYREETRRQEQDADGIWIGPSVEIHVDHRVGRLPRAPASWEAPTKAPAPGSLTGISQNGQEEGFKEG